MWVYKEKSKKEQQPILAKYGSSRSKQESAYALVDWGRPKLSLSDFDEKGYTQEFDYYEDKLTPIGRWYYYTATYNGKESGDNTIRMYINGKLIKSQEFSSSISNSSGPLWIGGDNQGNYFKGIMDEFRIYNYALTSSQIKQLYNMRDRIEAVPSKKVNLSSLKRKQNIQLTTTLHTYKKEKMDKLNVTSKAQCIKYRPQIENK